jgi:hypothetical protein
MKKLKHAGLMRGARVSVIVKLVSAERADTEKTGIVVLQVTPRRDPREESNVINI